MCIHVSTHFSFFLAHPRIYQRSSPSSLRPSAVRLAGALGRTSNCNNNRPFFNRKSSLFKGNSPFFLHFQWKSSENSWHLDCNSQYRSRRSWIVTRQRRPRVGALRKALTPLQAKRDLSIAGMYVQTDDKNNSLRTIRSLRWRSSTSSSVVR